VGVGFGLSPSSIISAALWGEHYLNVNEAGVFPAKAINQDTTQIIV